MFYRFRKEASRQLADSPAHEPWGPPDEQSGELADQLLAEEASTDDSLAEQQRGGAEAGVDLCGAAAEPRPTSEQDPEYPSEPWSEEPTEDEDCGDDDHGDDDRDFDQLPDESWLEADETSANAPQDFAATAPDPQLWAESDQSLSPPTRTPRPRHYLHGLKRAVQASKGPAKPRSVYNVNQRLLILDTWQRSGLPAGDFAELVSVSKHTLYGWKKRFEQHGPEGLMDQPRKAPGTNRLSEVTRRTILMLKTTHPDWGVERISQMLTRGPGLSASPSAILRVLREAGYESTHVPTKPNPPPKVQRFERAQPNQLWQTDLFTFVLKQQNRRLYLVAFMDDHSRFIVSIGVHASGTTPLVIEALEAGIASYGPPQEVLTDNGPQFKTWRGKSRFSHHLEKRGIRQIVARPKRPQTLGKVERFWGTLWRELLEGSIFVDLADARARIGHFIDYYNFQRPHSGIDGLVPADRFFRASQEVQRTLGQRVAANALELARHGTLKEPFYVTGQVSGQGFSLHSEGERLILQRQGEPRQEIELAAADRSRKPAEAMPAPVCPQAIIASHPNEPADRPPPAPGESPLSGFEARLSQAEGGGQ